MCLQHSAITWTEDQHYNLCQKELFFAFILVPPCYLIFTGKCIFCPLMNSSSPSATYMRQQTGPVLLQVMACRPFGAKPVTSQNVDKPKRRQPNRRQSETSTNLNVDKPKRRQTETSTNQDVDKPKRRQTKTPTDRNVDKPKRRQTETSTNQKRRHSKTSA